MKRKISAGLNLTPWMVALTCVSLNATADDVVNQSKTKVESVTGQSNTIPDSHVVDDLITNNNLRAYSGSTSRWSIASQFNYNGGTIFSPLSEDRPNISDASGTTIKSDLDGAVSVKYNLSVQNSLMAGVGMRWIAPTALKGPSNYNGTVFDVMNPYFQFQHIYKWVGIQSVLQTQVMQWTQTDQTALGYGQQVSIDQENMYEIGSSGLSVGASVMAQVQFFNKSGSLGNPGDSNYIPNVAALQSVYLFAFAPIVEYQLSSKVNLRTLVSLFTFEHYASESNALAFNWDHIYQSVGVGIAVTRDVFLYPNVQFLPGQLQASLTNVGLGATINVF